MRLDAIVLQANGSIVLRKGEPHIALPKPPETAAGETRLANIYIAGHMEKLGPANLFPVLETAYPEAPKPSPTPAEQFLPKTMAKLKGGQPLKILAWGDSVTDMRLWQTQFVERLKRRFPTAKIELVTEAWGGRNSGSYLAEPPGSAHNYREKVLGAKPDLVISEFVNDSSLQAKDVQRQYGGFLKDFVGIGAEWIILTPHYVGPSWMGFTQQKEIDDDPRPYVKSLREFAQQHKVALADASLRWGRLWRQGIPYLTLLGNGINHPDERGHRLFADAIEALFP